MAYKYAAQADWFKSESEAQTAAKTALETERTTLRGNYQAFFDSDEDWQELKTNNRANYDYWTRHYLDWVDRYYQQRTTHADEQAEWIADGAARCAVARLYHGIAGGYDHADDATAVLTTATESGADLGDISDAATLIDAWLEAYVGRIAPWPAQGNTAGYSADFTRTVPSFVKHVCRLVAGNQQRPYDPNFFNDSTNFMARFVVMASGIDADTFRSQLVTISNAVRVHVDAYIAAQTPEPPAS